MVHYTQEKFIQSHRNQLESSGVPEYFWPTLYKKITGQVFDAGDVFSLLQIDYGDEPKAEHDPVWQLQVNAELGLKHTDPQCVYLVDHAWTFRVEHARAQLLQSAPLRERMAYIMGLNPKLEPAELTQQIFIDMWRYCNTYSIGNAENIEDRLPVWYIMDEVGSAMQHSDEPNFRMVPFMHVREQMTYSLVFPVKDVEHGDSITRDFVEGTEGLQRKALALPWTNGASSFLEVNFDHVRQGPEYFLSGHVEETLPTLCNFEGAMTRSKKDKFKVFSEYDLIEEFLTDDHFEVVGNEDEADIFWYTKHFKSFEELSLTPDKFVNQFPFEYVLTIKDLLCITCRRRNTTTGELETSPSWLPRTYNLKTELAQFVSYYQHRARLQLDNHWIVKPFNLARGMDTHITNNLNYVMRLPLTGSKIAQKYIETPVLFHRPEVPGKVKFDVRYVILLRRVKPLEVFVYRNFFLRFANKPFELDKFDEYESHFTVMNYTENAVLKHMKCSDFKVEWKRQYPDVSWECVEGAVFKMLREIFECASLEPPPCGISESPQSRALYAADLMLEWNASGNVQPKILEINWTPDCKRACDYYEDFYNDIFKLLFLDIGNDEVFEKL